MKCPACDENSLEDNPRFGILNCSQCHSRLIYSTEGLREAEVPLGKVIERKRFPMKRVIIKREGPQLPTKARCIGCGGAILSSMHRTGSILQGMAFMRKNMERVLQTELGQLETWERTYPLVRTEQVTERKAVPFLKREKGSLCEECAGNIDMVEIPQKDGSSRREPLIKVDPTPGFAGSSILPKYERHIPSQEPATQPITPANTNKVDHHHWLNVGRKK
jgi:hypothetical protein